MSPILYNYPKSLFKKDGTIKSSRVSKKEESEAFMNGLVLSLYNQITQTSTKSDWWDVDSDLFSRRFCTVILITTPCFVHLTDAYLNREGGSNKHPVIQIFHKYGVESEWNLVNDFLETMQS